MYIVPSPVTTSPKQTTNTYLRQKINRCPSYDSWKLKIEKGVLQHLMMIKASWSYKNHFDITCQMPEMSLRFYSFFLVLCHSQGILAKPPGHKSGCIVSKWTKECKQIKSDREYILGNLKIRETNIILPTIGSCTEFCGAILPKKIKINLWSLRKNNCHRTIGFITQLAWVTLCSLLLFNIIINCIIRMNIWFANPTTT